MTVVLLVVTLVDVVASSFEPRFGAACFLDFFAAGGGEARLIGLFSRSDSVKSRCLMRACSWGEVGDSAFAWDVKLVDPLFFPLWRVDELGGVSKWLTKEKIRT